MCVVSCDLQLPCYKTYTNYVWRLLNSIRYFIWCRMCTVFKIFWHGCVFIRICSRFDVCIHICVHINNILVASRAAGTVRPELWQTNKNKCIHIEREIDSGSFETTCIDSLSIHVPFLTCYLSFEAMLWVNSAAGPLTGWAQKGINREIWN